jgi:peptidoglycan/xylan/chitin deacetylase (PgdA/CDA1 family)
MIIRNCIKVALIRLFSIFYFSKKSKVIFYHDIDSDKRYTVMSTSIELFKKHINIIRENGYEIVNEITKPLGQIEICFDDAFLGLYDNIELIKELNIPIHLFVVSSYLEKENHINKEQLLLLNNLTQIKISSHTQTHQVLNLASESLLKNELENSKNLLEGLLNNSVDTICYPEGKFNNRVVELAEGVGYKRQYSSLPGFYFNDFFPNVKRRSLVQFAAEKEFKAILKGGDHVLAFWYKFKHYNK